MRKKDFALKFLFSAINSLGRKYKIRTFANYLVNVPEETEEDLEDIIAMMEDLDSEIVSLNIFTPYPGTEIYTNAPYKFKKEEYPMLTHATNLIYTHPEKLLYAKHNINLLEWTNKYMHKYNKVWNNLKFHLRLTFWRILCHSKNKVNYLKQSVILVKEFINLKIS